MPALFCTVRATSPEEACEAGARDLGVACEDLMAEAVDATTWRVTQVRAPFEVTVELSHDKQEAYANFTPPLGDAPQPTREDVLRALSAARISHGILTDAIDAALAQVVETGVERRRVVVARGNRPTPGQAAAVQRLYELQEEGAVRVRRIVRAGELLMEKEHATVGTPGRTVDGDVLAAPQGQDAWVATGTGIAVNEDTTRWTADVPGFGYLTVGADEALSVRPAVTLDADHMHAYIELLSPTADEAPLRRDELDQAIEAAGVVHGRLPERLDAAWTALKEQGDLPKPIRIADGTPPTRGQNGRIDYAIDVTVRAGELVEETHRIDYRERHAVHNVAANQLIGVWYPAEEGIPGRGVDGVELPAEPGEENVYTFEENLEMEAQPDGGTAIRATTDGMLVIKQGATLSVLDVINVPGDVDFEVGNIDARGGVQIKGTVRAGFRVTATKDISVGESTEDALIETDATLFVKQGIIGGEQGHITAGEHVIAGYMNRAHIRCKGDVEIRDSDTNSVIECGGVLRATDGHGRLVGGRYTAGRGVVARVLGSEGCTPTVLSVGHDPELLRETETLREQREAIRDEMIKITEVLEEQKPRVERRDLTHEEAAALRELFNQRKQLAEENDDLTAQIAALETRLAADESPTVDVLDKVHEGVEIQIRGWRYRVRDHMGASRFRLDPDAEEVVVESL